MELSVSLERAQFFSVYVQKIVGDAVLLLVLQDVQSYINSLVRMTSKKTH